MPLQTTESGTSEFKDNIKHSRYDLTNNKNTAAEKMGDGDSPITFYTGRTDWKALLSGSSKTG